MPARLIFISVFVVYTIHSCRALDQGTRLIAHLLAENYIDPSKQLIYWLYISFIEQNGSIVYFELCRMAG